VSGAGKNGIEELLTQTKVAIEGETPAKGSTFPKAIAFDCIPQIGGFCTDGSEDDGFSSEELKIMKETRKIMRLPEVRVSAFTVRVPTLNSHAETVWVKLKHDAANREEVEATLASGAGLHVTPAKSCEYPTQAMASGEDPVYVGRIHRDPSEPGTWMMWVVADNLRKGAALNGIQIAEAIYGL
jgi:aspartate-semialdehyde dehydrogenase